MEKCVFNPKWVSSYGWVMKAEEYNVYCKKLIDLGKMGENAVRSSHMRKAKGMNCISDLKELKTV